MQGDLRAIRLAFDTMDVASGLAEAPEHLITICHTMQAHDFGLAFGPDYAR